MSSPTEQVARVSGAVEVGEKEREMAVESEAEIRSSSDTGKPHLWLGEGGGGGVVVQVIQ